MAIEQVMVGVVLGFIAGTAVAEFRTFVRRRKWQRRNWKSGVKTTKPQVVNGPWVSKQETTRPVDPADQLRVVMNASYVIQPLLNKAEARVFRELDRAVISLNPSWQVMAQVSLGEILQTKSAEAYACINSKRVDLLLMDDECQPRHAIEYQGGAHHQGTAAARDAVKKEALRRAGIGYHEVVSGHTTPSDLRRLVEKLVEPLRTTE